MRCLIACLMLILGAPAGRAEVPLLTADQAAALAETLPDPLFERLRGGSRSLLADVADMIASYGEARGLTAEGIDWRVAAERAAARAQALTPLVKADLDADGTVTRAEMDRLMALTAEGSRGRLDLAFRAADLTGDEKVDERERRVYLMLRAADRMSVADEEVLQALMLLDLDHDGYLTLEEFTGAMLAVQTLDADVVRAEL
ncbi:hypothetical protein [Frigidibacter sp. SD6-1]|uniref:EF-hand domain-containing protein n=1 Tax=Frigidibacter sp. SD6-1 TaxID=3032581 RepID=UPI0024DF932E|nr:hypothetical protein [Frigidibacter sp. SD6-1]